MKQRLGYIETVQFIGVDGEKSVEVKCDTGAKRTSICQSLGHRIGLGEPVDSVSVRSSNGREERDVYLVHVVIDGEKIPVEISVTDRAEMTYDAILGRDVLDEYLVDSGDSFVLGD